MSRDKLRAAIRDMLKGHDHGWAARVADRVLDLFDQELLEAGEALIARHTAEIIMRDDRRRQGEHDIAEMHGDRAFAFKEASEVLDRLTAKESTP